MGNTFISNTQSTITEPTRVPCRYNIKQAREYMDHHKKRVNSDNIIWQEVNSGNRIYFNNT